MKRRIKSACAVLLLLVTVLNLCACMQSLPPEDFNHFTEKEYDGESYLILEDDYDGIYDVQFVQFKIPEYAEPDKALASFSYTGLMNLAEYTAFCNTWGIERVYRDNTNYAVDAGIQYRSDFADVRLGGVRFVEETGEMLLYRRVFYPTYEPTAAIAYMLVIPTEEHVQDVTCVDLFLPDDVLGLTMTEAKPVLYLYPEEETALTVTLGHPERLSCVYPAYENGWEVTAQPDGTLTDANGRDYYALYWEGRDAPYTMTDEGFCIAGKDTAAFLEDKLALLGLTEREAEEFIVYWLPQMEDNACNYIRFASEAEIEDYMPLGFTVQPDSVIRINMVWKALDAPVTVKEQQLTTPAREGFVAVEWGGVHLK